MRSRALAASRASASAPDYMAGNGPKALAPSTDVLHLARTYGITRDQARRLIKKFRKDLKKLDESARILSARSSRNSKFGSDRQNVAFMAAVADGVDHGREGNFGKEVRGASEQGGASSLKR